MRFASRVIPHAGGWARGYLLVAMGVVALGVASCNDQHIGRACNTNAPADAGTSGVSIVSSPSLQCPSRICLQPSGAATDDAMCTATCSTDDDCSDADPGTTCKKGFVCAWPTTAGPFCCQKMCVCHDFISVPPGGFQVPATCMSPGSSPDAPSPPTCQNVH